MTARLDPGMSPGPACARCGAERHWTGSRWRCSACYNRWQAVRRNNLPTKSRDAERVRANELRMVTRANWSREQRERQNARAQAWRDAHREQHREATRAWYQANADHARAAKLVEYQRNPEAFIARNFLRKSRLLEAVCENGSECVDAEFPATLYAQPCIYCSAPTEHADHFHPLAKGGAHCRENLFPACSPCNRSKHARDPVEWLVGARGDQ